MRFRGQIIEANYKKGVSQRTGNDYELTEYVLQGQDEQGHNHKLTFVLSGQKMYDEKVHKGDMVEVSIQLGLREYNGNKYNNVENVYYVQKLNADGTNTKEALMAQQAQKQAQAPQVPPVQDGGDDLPF